MYYYKQRFIHSISFLIKIIILFLVISPTFSHETSPKQPPHIIIIIVDDIGVDDLGFSQKLHNNLNSTFWTPNIDKLATNSIQFSQSYAHPTCTPSRASLLTGRYAHKTGLPFPIIGTPVIGLDPSIPSLPELLSLRGFFFHFLISLY